ncbi:CLC_0170 family protein [Paenibacillus sp. RC67]|uniref:CLC_0170 family protein n=1 Tax=Paenibacillus sp. RC67 TaxID=3039392 RepID=UPI0024ADACF3|nr:CLC_0170 family protein [Paenibacillus sp. RC67]
MPGSYSSYLTYSVPLLLITGLFILLIDSKGYEMESWIKEMKTARVLGWINVILGVLLIGVNWAIA